MGHRNLLFVHKVVAVQIGGLEELLHLFLILVQYGGE
jgi:hypothetical protein